MLNSRFIVPPGSSSFAFEEPARPARPQVARVSGQEEDFDVPVDSRSGNPRETSYTGQGDAIGEEQYPKGMLSEDRTTGRIGGLSQSHSISHRKFKFHGQDSEKGGQGVAKV